MPQTKSATKKSSTKTTNKPATTRRRKVSDIKPAEPAIKTKPAEVETTVVVPSPFDPSTLPEKEKEYSTETHDAIVEEISAGITNLTPPEPKREPVRVSEPVMTKPVDGKSDIGRKIMARIVALAIEETEGVALAKKDFRTVIEDIIKGRTDGIRVETGATEAAVDMLARVHYGADIPRVTACLRENVAKRIREMTGLKVVEVNVIVQDIASMPSSETTI